RSESIKLPREATDRVVTRAMHETARFARSGAVLALLNASALSPGYALAIDAEQSLVGRTGRLHSTAKLCVLLTENTNKTFKYLTEWRDSLAGSAMSGFDSRRMVADVTNTLQSRFREVTPIESTAELQSRGCSLAASLDLKITLSPGIRKEGVAEITTSFADNRGARIDDVSVVATRYTWSAIGEAAADAWHAAITDFGNKLDKSAPLLAFVGDSPGSVASGTASAPQLDASTMVDIAFWDSIKTSGNPADFQAYLRKFPNGSFESLAHSRLAALGEAAPVRLNPIAQPANSKFNFGNYHALVIGIDNYRSVTPLKTAVSDARTVAELLQKEYGFKVTLLLDATRNQMLDSFDDLRRRLTDKDNLLIYYAGHGHLDADSDRGFWLPVDADANRRANWLSNSDIADVVRGTRAKHVLVVADSCYAGTLTRSLSVQMAALDDFTRLSQKRARTALVSGGLEPVEDSGGGKHSVFAKAFLDALWANTGVVDMSQIFSSMRRQVVLSAQQTPQYSDIRQVGHEGGDFIFVRRK
ncbi:MAG: caspase family protein, partial [Proteobacteria bacterium]|nr:caspase family protein [Pseudomonadota bacterium]